MREKGKEEQTIEKNKERDEKRYKKGKKTRSNNGSIAQWLRRGRSGFADQENHNFLSKSEV